MRAAISSAIHRARVGPKAKLSCVAVMLQVRGFSA